MKRLILAAMTIHCLSVGAAASIQLATDTLPVGVSSLTDAENISPSFPASPVWLSMAAGDSPSVERMTLRMVSDTSDDVLGWQVALLIVGASGSSGTVGFNTAVLPVDYIFVDKSPYFFSDVPDVSGAPAKDSLFGFDIGFPGTLTAATVTASGGNLLSLDFMASSNAQGWFGVFAQPSGLSEWSDGDMMPQEFSNIFSNIEGPTLIGLIHVDSVPGVIPEPASIMVWLGLAVFGVFFNRKRQRP